MTTENHSYRRLVDGWSHCLREGPPYIFPEDKILQREKQYVVTLSNFRTFLKSDAFGSKNDNRLHLNLSPVPYTGNLKNAKVFILMLNPGLNPGDYFGEQLRGLRRAISRNLRQQNESEEYPFYQLNPEFSWHPGFRYWNNKLYELAELISKTRRCIYTDALAYLAKRVCVLQIVPYHSRIFGLPRNIRSNLGSSRAIVNFVKDVVVPKTKRGRALLVVARGKKDWGIRKGRNIVILKPSESRAAHLSLRKQGGRIADFLSLT